MQALQWILLVIVVVEFVVYFVLSMRRDPLPAATLTFIVVIVFGVPFSWHSVNNCCIVEGLAILGLTVQLASWHWWRKYEAKERNP